MSKCILYDGLLGISIPLAIFSKVGNVGTFKRVVVEYLLVGVDLYPRFNRSFVDSPR